MLGLWKQICGVVICVLFANSALANACLEHKQKSDIYVDLITPKTNLVQDDGLADMWHGLVEAAWVNQYDVGFFVQPVKNGICVGINSVNLNMGYEEFNVKIDVRHKKDSCSYNAVLAHENKHIDVYNNVASEFLPDFKRSLESATDSIFPIFVKTYDDVKNATTELKENFFNHPELIVLMQRLEAAQEIRNKRIDQEETGEDLKKCML